MDMEALLEQLPYLKASFPNPQAPLRFETIGEPGAGGSKPSIGDPSMAMHGSPMSMDAMGMYQFGANFPFNPNRQKAHGMALRGYNLLLEKSKQVADKALELDPECVEAFNLKAYNSNTYEEALEFFKKGEAAGVELGIDKEAASVDNAWHLLTARPWLRSVFGVGNTLRKMGRYSEALPKYEMLIKLVPQSGNGGGFQNFHVHYAPLVLRVHGAEECLKRLKKHPARKQLLGNNSGMLTSAFTIAYCQKKLGIVKHFPVNAGIFTRPDSYSTRSEAMDYAESSKSIDEGMQSYMAVHAYPIVTEMLLGERNTGEERAAPMFLDGDDETGGAIYLKENGDLWRDDPEMLLWLRKLRNTHYAAVNLGEAQELLSQGKSTAKVICEAMKYIKGGVFTEADAFVGPAYSAGSILHVAAAAGSAPVVRALVNQGCKAGFGKPQLGGLTPLCLLFYHSMTPDGPEIMRLLIEAGDEVLKQLDDAALHDNGLTPATTPLHMAAAQANWIELDAGLSTVQDPLGFGVVSDKGDAVPLLQHLALEIMQSSVGPCLHAKQPCQRCKGGGRHSPTADMYKSLQVLMKYGMDPNMPFGFKKKSIKALFDAGAKDLQFATYRRFAKGAVAVLSKGISAVVASALKIQGDGGGSGGGGSSSKDCTSEATLRTCGCCSKQQSKMSKCGRCGNVYYCSADCQRIDWQEHKKTTCVPKAS